MTLPVGERIGRFEILGCLGAGGMGEVYEARDPHLRREVAIKILPAAFSGDPGRRQRFEHEARAAGSLNHPNIVAVYDVGMHSSDTWIVMELLVGETLRRRMDGRPLSPRTAVNFAIQIASGLSAAHERGIVHRDIKPANLFITRDGRVKILDFGLAKLIGGDATETVTLDGVPRAPVVGTAIYMSPEQVRGGPIDHRSDIFSFGTVLYEMLAGFAPFRRATPAETLGAIVHDEPAAFSDTTPVPAALERIVRHCLEKDPVARCHSATDLVFDLENLQHTNGVPPPPERHAHVNRQRTVLTAAAIAGFVLAAILGYVAGTHVAPAEPGTAYTARRVTDFPGLEASPSISPDRRSVAFTANVNGRRHVFVRLMAGGPPLQITKDQADHEFPRWSPDASEILYFSAAEPGNAQGTIWRVPALGGSPRRVVSSVSGADISRTGRLTCFGLVNRRVQLVTSALDGSDVRLVTQSDAEYHRAPRWSPDGKWIAFERGDGVRFDLFVVSADGGEPRQLTQDRTTMSGLAWYPDSTGIVYASSRGSTVPYLPPLRLWEARLDGRPTRAITPPEASYEQPDVHSSGLVAAVRTRMLFEIFQIPFDASATDSVRPPAAITHQTGVVLTPTAAPKGDEIAFLSDSGGHSNVWVMSTRTRDLRQITFEEDAAVSVGVPVWSPDGTSIAFVSSKGLTGFDFGIWLVNPDGSNLRRIATPGLGLAWSPDGKWLYYADTSAGALKRVAASGGSPITVRSEPTRNVIGLSGDTLYYVVERALVDGRPEFEIRTATPEDGPSRVLARIPAARVASWQIINPSLSPDGHWLALPLTDGFTTNIWAMSTTSGELRRVTDFGDRATFIARRVSWSPDGTSILAAIGEGDADVVLLDGLISQAR